MLYAYLSIYAYIFIEARPAKAQEVKDKISQIPGAKNVHLVTGPYDIVALVEAPDIKALGALVISQIQVVEGVNKTLTSVIAD
jgi:DNA-binding Lrp family transcriptional regulator